ncbi:MAG: helix-turn-helix transcriptional regulator [Kordiimonadaceae bacterium]|nr:helix-turn-helix transcriptional regulator [Kordiimonadaceae bacterium]
MHLMTTNHKVAQQISVDKFVGGTIRARRRQLKITQSELGKSVGVTFQQIQKYEKGANRVGAGRLFHIASTLSVPVEFFFEGVEEILPEVETNHREVARVDDEARETLFLSLYSILDPKISWKIRGLVKALSQSHEQRPQL